MSPWRESALKNGYRSCIAIPLLDERTAFGALILYSEMYINGFTSEEVGLLEEMANDVAFGIISLKAREERRRAEEALHETNRKLNLLTGITRHDLNNQLMVLSGYLDLLELNGTDPSANKYLSKAKASMEQIFSMVQFTKAYEDIGVRTPVWQDISKLVTTSMKEIPFYEVKVLNDVPLGLEIYADPLIQKVFHNLIDNTVRYGDPVTFIRFSVEEHDGREVLICADDGAGIPSDMKAKLFSRGIGKNHGLGLFLSREILAITGITINEEGEPGQGAKFVMTIPPDRIRLN